MALPIPNLDDKTFEQLVEEARKLIPVHVPEWTNHNLSDPGIAFIDLFAWLTELQLYSLNRISERHYLKYLKMLGVKPYPAAPAGVYVTFTGSGVVNVGEQVLAEDSQTGGNITFETDETLEVLPVNLKQVIVYAGYKYADVTDFNRPNKNFFYAFGEKAEKGSSLYLGLDFDDKYRSSIENKPLNLFIKLFEDDLPPPSEHGYEKEEVILSVDVEWGYINNKLERTPLQNIKEGPVKRFYRTGVLEIPLPKDLHKTIISNYPESETLFWLYCRIITQNGADLFYEIPPRIERILLNTVSATQGKTVKEEFLKNSLQETLSSGLPNQVFETKFRPIIPKSQTLGVIGSMDQWEAVDDFDASVPEDKHYNIDYPNGRITFGNGINGLIPQKGREIKITYRYGGGEKENIGASIINKVHGKLRVDAINHFPASGGKEAEKIEEAILRLRKELRIPYTAVSLSDFEKIATSTPGLRVVRAKAIAAKDENKVKVVTVPYSPMEKPMPSKGFKETICFHLDTHRLITTDIEIKNPEYVRVSVSAFVKIKGGFNPDYVRSRCIEGLNEFLSPIRRKEGENEWPFGRAVYKSEIYETLEDVEGVDGILKLSLSASGEGFVKYEVGDVVIKPESLVYPGGHSVEIVLPQAACAEKKS